jgi:hypothetical protein
MNCEQAIELLPEYFTDQLEAAQRAAVEAHLQTCAACQAEARELQDTLYGLARSVPPVVPSAKVWQAIQSQIQPPVAPPVPAPRIPVWRMFAVFGLIMLGWMGYLFYMYRSSSSEATRIERWQAQPQVKSLELKSYQGQVVGTLMWMPDGRCLFVIHKPPPAGQVYQAWGRKEGQLVSLGTFVGRTLEYECEGKGFARLGVTVEAAGGSAKPTTWLGSVPFW